MTDLANFYIEKLMQRFEQQRIPAIESQLKSAVQGADELPSSYWSRLEHLYVQVPNVCTNEQLYLAFIKGLRVPSVKKYVENVLDPMAKSQWPNQFPAITTAADQLSYNAAPAVDLFTSPTVLPTITPATVQPAVAASPAQPAPAPAASHSAPAPEPSAPQQHSEQQSRQCDQKQHDEPYCALHGYRGHATEDCLEIKELRDEKRARSRASHAAASRRYDRPRDRDYEQHHDQPSAFSTTISCLQQHQQYHSPHSAQAAAYAAPLPQPSNMPYGYSSSSPGFPPSYSAPSLHGPQPSYSQQPPYGPQQHNYGPPSHHPAPPSYYPPSSYAPSSASAYNGQPAAMASQVPRERRKYDPCATPAAARTPLIAATSSAPK